MHPILFVLELGSGRRPIGSFGVLLALGMIAGALIATRAASRAGIDAGDALATSSIMASAALFGGYAMQVVVETLRGASLHDAASVGGLTFYGAPLVGALGLLVSARVLGFSPLRFADAVVGAVPVAHALGRIGCFFAGCCYGREWHGPLAVTITHPLSTASLDPVARHPVQLYESLLLLLVAIPFVFLPPKQVGSGRRTLAYFAAYACVRLVTERFRGDAERGFVLPGVSTSDAVSFALLAATAIAYAAIAQKERA